MLWLLCTHLGLSGDEAYSLASVTIDFGITQLVDGTVGCHAAFDRSIVGLTGPAVMGYGLTISPKTRGSLDSIGGLLHRVGGRVPLGGAATCRSRG